VFVVVYFVIDSVRKFLGTPSCIIKATVDNLAFSLGKQGVFVCAGHMDSQMGDYIELRIRGYV